MALDYFKFVPREEITYFPEGVTADAVTLDAVVFRSPQSVILNGLIKTVSVFIPRGSTTGKLNAVTVGKDEITIRTDPYGGESRCRVVRLLKSDSNSWFVQAVA
jgi:hypothetical protein